MLPDIQPTDSAATTPLSPAGHGPLSPQLLERISRLTLLARHAVQGAIHGLHRSPMQGLSVEFSQHRPYVVGDELRHLDWKILARSDRHVVKQYEQETNLRAMILVDASRSMAYRDKFSYAQTLAAAMAHLLIRQGDAVALRLTPSDSDGLGPSSAPGQLHAIAHHLLAATAQGQARLSHALDRLAMGLKRHWLVILISDLFGDDDATDPHDATDDLLQAMGRIRHAGHDLLVYQTLAPSEITFDLGADGHGVTVIKNMETAADFHAEPSQIRRQVQLEIARFLHQLDQGAKRHAIQLHRCLTDHPVEQAMIRSLHERTLAMGHHHPTPLSPPIAPPTAQ